MSAKQARAKTGAKAGQVLILTCGGTFDKNRFNRTGKFICGPTMVPAMLDSARVEGCVVRGLMRKDSLDMNDGDRAKVVAAARRASHTQIVIVHGTDTLVDTALALKAAKLQKTVVLVGACAPAIFTGSDAAFNLGFGIACARLRRAGVWVAMHATCWPASKVVKNTAKLRFEDRG